MMRWEGLFEELYDCDDRAEIERRWSRPPASCVAV